jgi:outer membrane protein assembly factor BamB
MRRVHAIWALLILVSGCAACWWLATTNDARIFALHVQTGDVAWSAELPSGTRMVGNPTVAHGRVLLSTAGPEPLGGSTDRWRLAAYDAASGRRLWQHEPPPERQRNINAASMGLTSPYVTDDHIFVRVETSDASTLQVLDAATGREIWSVERVAFGHYSRHVDIVVSQGRVLVPIRSDTDLSVRAFHERDGAELWSVDLGAADFPRTDLGPLLAASDDTFYVSLADGVVALDASNGSERFRIGITPGESVGQVTLVDGQLLRLNGRHSIDAYDPQTGHHRWNYRSPFGEIGGVLRSFGARDGLLAVYCACDTERDRRSGWLLGVDSSTGAERWRALVDAYMDIYQDIPVVGGGLVLTGSEQGDVVARSATDGSVRWRMPRDRGQFVATNGAFVYVTDRAIRWQHWLIQFNLAGR